jgi:hypothetical protein
MAYRNDVDALEHRLATLQRELDGTTRQRDDAARMLTEARDRAAADGLAADWAAGGPQRRRRRRIRIILATTMLAVVGGFFTFRVTRAHASDDLERVIARLSTFADQMCGCADRACADKVAADMTAWSAEMARTESSPRDMDPDVQARVTKIAERLGSCMTRVMSDPEPRQYESQLGRP